jgi:hypothetical protein
MKLKKLDLIKDNKLRNKESQHNKLVNNGILPQKRSNKIFLSYRIKLLKRHKLSRPVVKLMQAPCKVLLRHLEL